MSENEVEVIFDEEEDPDLELEALLIEDEWYLKKDDAPKPE